MAHIYRLQFAHVAVPVLSFVGMGAADCYGVGVVVGAVVGDGDFSYRSVIHT